VNTPGFYAEASLSKPSRSYRTSAAGPWRAVVAYSIFPQGCVTSTAACAAATAACIADPTHVSCFAASAACTDAAEQCGVLSAIEDAVVSVGETIADLF
jgi:hypothetical protein